MSRVPHDWRYDHVIDSLNHGCGQLLLDLKLEFEQLAAGTRVMVASRDAGAPIEIPAWCRLTRHRLIAAQPPFYLIERRGATVERSAGTG